MSESLWLLNRGENPPLSPTTSGGYRPDKATPNPGSFASPCRYSDILQRLQIQVSHRYPPSIPHIEYQILVSFRTPPGTPPADRPYAQYSTGYHHDANKWNPYNNGWIEDLPARRFTMRTYFLPYFRLLAYPLGPNHPEQMFVARTSLDIPWTSTEPETRPWSDWIDSRPPV